jgi:hypothetical protein
MIRASLAPWPPHVVLPWSHQPARSRPPLWAPGTWDRLCGLPGGAEGPELALSISSRTGTTFRLAPLRALREVGSFLVGGLTGMERATAAGRWGVGRNTYKSGSILPADYKANARWAREFWKAMRPFSNVTWFTWPFV